MQLSGSLKEFPVAKVLQFLNMDAATGMLNLRNGKSKISIALKDGNILDVEDMFKTKEARIRDLLVDTSHISESRFEKLLEEKKLRLVPIGTILQDHNYLTADEHAKLVKLVYSTILFKALKWRDGNYDFEKKGELLPTELDEPISVASLMLNSARQEDEWPSIRRYVPSAASVFKRSATMDTNSWKKLIGTLGPMESDVAQAIDGRSSVKSIAERKLYAEFDVSRVLCDLVINGHIVRLEDVGEEKKEDKTFSIPVKLGLIAKVPLAITVFIIFSVYIWIYYIAPTLASPDRSLVSVAHAGYNVDNVNKLRLLRLQHAFYTYLDENGAPPSSLAMLARMRYCNEDDLKCLDGGYFILKLVGRKENYAILQGTDQFGEPLENLMVEIMIR